MKTYQVRTHVDSSMEQSRVIAALLLHRWGTENGAPTLLVLLSRPHLGCCRLAFNVFVIGNTNPHITAIGGIAGTQLSSFDFMVYTRNGSYSHFKGKPCVWYDHWCFLGMNSSVNRGCVARQAQRSKGKRRERIRGVLGTLTTVKNKKTDDTINRCIKARSSADHSVLVAGVFVCRPEWAVTSR